MAKRISSPRVSVAQIEEYINNNFKDTKTIKLGEIEVEVRSTIEISKLIEIVNGVVGASFDKDNAAFTPEIADYILRASIITYYTNITLPENTEKAYRVLYISDIFTQVIETISYDQLVTIMSSIDKKTEYIKAEMINGSKKKMDELMQGVMALYDPISEMMSTFTPEELGEAVKSIPNISIDESKLMESYLNSKR